MTAKHVDKSAGRQVDRSACFQSNTYGNHICKGTLNIKHLRNNYLRSDVNHLTYVSRKKDNNTLTSHKITKLKHGFSPKVVFFLLYN